MRLNGLLKATMIALVLGGTSSLASAEVLTYTLSNHPDGGARPPLYGLRLDGLLGDTSEEFTFSFDPNDGASMQLIYNSADANHGGAATIEIKGQAFGGLDAGPTYDTDNSGLWDVNFIYTANVTQDSGGYKVTGHDFVSNTGSISMASGNWSGAVDSYGLVDFQGSHSYSFKFLPDGHRIGGDNSTLVGRGWLNWYTDPTKKGHHEYASDWLFVGELEQGGPTPVPEPSTMIAWGLMGLSAVTLNWYRRRRR